MKSRKHIAIGLTAAMLVLGAGTGIATGAGGVHHAHNNAAGIAGHRGGGPPGAQGIASYLGLTTAELRTQLTSGKTLAAIATAQGKTVGGLEDAIIANAISHLDATQLANLKAHIDDIVNSTGPPAGHGPGGHGMPPGAQAIATYLGVTTAELRSQLASGKTLAAIAAAQGKTVSGLEETIIADASSHLDSTQLANLKAHIDDIVNSTGPPARGTLAHA